MTGPETRPEAGDVGAGPQSAPPVALRPMLDIDQVLAIVPVGKTTLFRMERDGKFPPSRYVSDNRRLWFADEVAAWQEALPANSKIGRRISRGART